MKLLALLDLSTLRRVDGIRFEIEDAGSAQRTLDMNQHEPVGAATDEAVTITYRGIPFAVFSVGGRSW
ncbi:MAG: hypothetical protein ACC628_12935 [Pirellulaceae bacterium]